jgi:hypothetical protein
MGRRGPRGVEAARDHRRKIRAFNVAKYFCKKAFRTDPSNSGQGAPPLLIPLVYIVCVGVCIVCVRAMVRVCVCACVRACVCLRACVRESVNSQVGPARSARRRDGKAYRLGVCVCVCVWGGGRCLPMISHPMPSIAVPARAGAQDARGPAGLGKD